MLSKKKRKVLIITGSRGEYGYILPIIKLIKQSSLIESKVLATNMHLLPEFGYSLHEFKQDDIDVAYKIHMALSGYTTITMVKSLGVFLMSLSDLLYNDQPDIILLAGDRGEQLMAAVAGAHVNIPVAHIQAGELSGNIDGMSRHAIARFVHIHFASNEDARNRLIRSGEEPFRVFQVGAPQLDDLTPDNVAAPQEIAKRFSLNLDKPIALVVQHPVTEQYLQSGQQMNATMEAIIAMGLQSMVIYPNNDAGSIAIQECIRNNRTVRIRVERNVSRNIYGGLMNVATVMVGNSSSGIIEAATFKLPAVNIGRRQAGRIHAKNVINVLEHTKQAIEEALHKAISPEFREGLKNIENPYGDGKSSERIVHVLETININEKLLYKNITY